LSLNSNLKYPRQLPTKHILNDEVQLTVEPYDYLLREALFSENVSI